MKGVGKVLLAVSVGIFAGFLVLSFLFSDARAGASATTTLMPLYMSNLFLYAVAGALVGWLWPSLWRFTGVAVAAPGVLVAGLFVLLSVRHSRVNMFLGALGFLVEAVAVSMLAA